MVIVSDGGEKEQVKEAKKLFQAYGITPYVVTVGTTKGAPVLDERGKPLTYKGRIAITKRNDTIGKMAQELGGAYVVAKAGNDDVKRIVDTIKKRFGTSGGKTTLTIKEQKEYFYYPLLLSLLLLLIGFSSLPKRNRA